MGLKSVTILKTEKTAMQISKIFVFLSIIFFNQVSQKVEAQIIPDQTLGSESSVINQVNELRERIEGGAIRGKNLFHSFQEFNIGNGLKIYFANPEGIANIFSRVTGNNISEIFGTLGVEGSANLFFLNPNGILFGENARLDLGGSFVATTADRVEFADGTVFSAKINDKLNVTWNAPIGLSLDGNNGSIIVNGNGHFLTFANPNFPVGSPIVGGGTSQSGLKVSPNRSLALIGSQININGGVLTSPSGNIEIVSVEHGNIKFDLNKANLVFNHNQVKAWKDIYLDNYALLDASGILDGSNNFTGGGTINLQSKNLQVDNGSLIFISNLGKAEFSGINVNATESVILKGITSPTTFGQGRQEIGRGLNIRNISSAQGGNISISAKELIIQNSSIIANDTFSEGLGGNINISVQNKILLSGSSPIPFSFSLIGTNSFGQGVAGNINLSGKSLLVQDGGLIISQAFSTGNSGNIEAIFFDEINIEGGKVFDSNPLDQINIPDTVLTSTIGTTAINSGSSGNVLVETAKLRLINGGRINSTANFLGKAGDIMINSEDSIDVKGKFLGLDNSNTNRSQIISSAEKNDTALKNFFNIPDTIQAESGSIIIKTNNLNIQDQGLLNVINDGTGDAGNIEINASNIYLNNQGEIAASTKEGNGGNIIIDSDRIQLDNGNISASAGGDGNGGNVDITADTSFLALNDSDVTATAEFGNGGKIRIDSKAVLGIEAREATPGNGTSDADASSEFGQDGTVAITNPQGNIQDPSVALLEPEISTFRQDFDDECLGKSPKVVYTGRTGFQGNRDQTEKEIYVPSPGFVPPQEEKEENENWDVFGWQKGDPVGNANAVRIDENGLVHLVTEISPENARELLCNIEEANKTEKPDSDLAKPIYLR